jgi:hypothetical protein
MYFLSPFKSAFKKSDMIFSFYQLPKLLELVGLGYTGWFVYRYLLFKVNLRHYYLFLACMSTDCSGIELGLLREIG